MRVYEGAGADARAAWEAFCEVAREPAFDPVELWDETQTVEAWYDFPLEAGFSKGWP